MTEKNLILFELFLALLSIPIALIAGKLFQREHPNLMPYTGGYFVASFGMLTGATMFTFLVIKLYQQNSIKLFELIAIHSLAILFIHWGVAKRKRWAWISAIIAQLVPILGTILTYGLAVFFIISPRIIYLIFSCIYLNSRWEEMRAPNKNS